MRASTALLAVCLLLSGVLSSAQLTFTALTSSQPSVTVPNLARSTFGNPSQLCYSYATGALTAQSDVSVILITNGNNGGSSNPTAYISLTANPPPSPTAYNASITGTGQSLLQTSQTVSSTPVNMLTTAGGTIYVCVINSGGNNFTGFQPTAFTLSFSVTTRIMLSGVQNFSVALPAATANSVQYVAWQFPLQVGQWVRGFYSFGAAYTTNAPMSSLSIVNTTSLASPQPAIIWSHDVWDQVASVPSADPTLPSYLPTRNGLLSNLNNAQGEAFIAFDRDQSYSFPNLASGWYLFAIFVPYAVPAGVFTLNNVFTTTAASTVTDISGDDFPQSALPSGGVTGVSLAAGGVSAYVVSLPAGSSVMPTITLTSTSGNADLFAIRTAVLEGAPLNAQGQTMDAQAAVYGGGAVVGTGSTFWVGPDVANTTPYVSGFDFTSLQDNGAGTVDSVSFVYASPNATYYTLFVVAQTATVFSLNMAYSTTAVAPVTTFGANNPNQVVNANNVPGGTVRYYQYTYNGVIDSNTDLSLILIVAGTALPLTYVSLSPYPSATNQAVNFTGSGSVLLHSANPTATNIVTATATTFYVAVLAGAGTAYWTLSVSSTERLQFSGLNNQSVMLGATAANTLQYVTWQFPPQTYNSARGYYSFAFTYSTNTSLNNLGGNGQSYATNQPCIIWQHQNFYNSDVQQSDPVITNAIPTGTNGNPAAMGIPAYKSAAFVTFDRDQSYPYSNTIEWYNFAIFVPFSVPAGAIISLSDVDTAYAAGTATDAGGDDFEMTTIQMTTAGSTSVTGTLQAGQMDVYNVIFPSTYYSSIVWMSLQSIGGNADLFSTPTPIFVGAPYFNYTSGTADDAGNTGWGQGANLGTNAIGNGLLVPTYQQNQTGQQTDWIWFAQSPAVSDAWVVIVFAVTPTSYNLTINVNNTLTVPAATLTSAGASSQLAAGGYQFYQYTTPTLDGTTDLSLVLATAGVNTAVAQGVTAYVNTGNWPYPGPGQFAVMQSINGSGSLLLSGSSVASLSVYATGLTTGQPVYIGVWNPTSAPLNYSIAPSLTTRVSISGLSNQSVTLPALAANSVQYVLWQFPEATTGGHRGYYSFAAAYTTNQPATALTLTATPVTAQPYLFWSHTDFNAWSGTSRAITDPVLPNTLPVSTGATYSTASVAIFDRDQTYPSTPATAYYSFAIYVPYAVPAGSVFAISSVGNNAASALDTGGDDFPLLPLTTGTPVSGSVAAGTVVGYTVALPASATSAQAMFTLTSTSGNADLFVVDAPTFYGLGGGTVFNYTTGTPNDANGGGWGQGINTLIGGGGWTGSGSAATITPPYASSTDSLSSPDTISLTYNSTQLQWYAVLVYGQRASTYTLSVSWAAVTYTELATTNGYTTVSSPPASSLVYYSYTISAANSPTSNTDLAVVLVSPAGSGIQAFVTVGPTVPSSLSAALYTINGTGSFLVTSSAMAASPVAYIPATAAAVGMQILIGVQTTTGGSASAYTLSISSTQRISFTGLVNQSSTLPATTPGTLQFISWSFPVETTNYVRNYMSFAAGYSSNLAISAIPAAGSVANQPSLQWAHNEWQGNTNPPIDPALQQVATGTASSATTQTGTFVTYDRDQSYPNVATSWYVWCLYIPYAVPAGGVFSLSNMDTIANIKNATDSGGNDFVVSPLSLNAAAGAATPIAQSQLVGYSLPLPPASGASVTVTLTSVSGQAYLYAINTQAFQGAPALDNYTGSVVENSIGYSQGAVYSPATTFGWFDGSTVNVPAFPYASAADSTTNSVSFTYSGVYNTFYTIVVFGAKAGSFQIAATGPTTALAVAPVSSASSSTGSSVQTSSSSTNQQSVSSSSSTASSSPSQSSSTAAPTSLPPVSSSSSSAMAASVSSSSSSSAASTAGSSSSGGSSLSGGAIAGIVIGSVVGVSLLLLIAFALCCTTGAAARRAKKGGNEDEDVVRQGKSGYSRSEDATAEASGQNVEMSQMQTGEAEQTYAEA